LTSLRSIAGRIATATLLCAVAFSSGSAQSAAPHANFSGTWTFDAAKSGASTFNPASGFYVVRQTADSFIIDRETTGATGTVTKARMVYGFDGKPWKNSLPLVGQMVEQSSIVTWEDGALVIHSTAQAGEAELVQEDRWSLSADGKTLSIKRQATYAGNSIGSPTWVFNRR
jgi:hypothetical protein